MDIAKIYFDMDGVLADFEKGYFLLCGQTLKDQTIRTKEESKALWKAIAASDHFYYRLPAMEGAVAFFRDICDRYPGKVEILTGIPISVAEASQDKKAWVKDVLQRDVPVHTVLRAEKKNFCKDSTCILIDDLRRNIQEWQEAGGTGILHTSIASTKAQIEALEK